MRKHSGLLLVGLTAMTLAACSSNEETIDVTKPDMGDTRIDLTSGQVLNDGGYYQAASAPVLSSMSTSNVQIFSLDAPAGERMSGTRSANYTAPSFGGVGNQSVEITGYGQPDTPRQSPAGYTRDSSSEDDNAKKNTRVQPLSPASADLLGTIYFDHSSVMLGSTDLQAIENAAKSFNASFGGMLSVEGHSSTRAQTENPVNRKRINLDVASKRAASVAKALIGFGVPGNKIKTVAWGEERPASSSDALGEEFASRRVEILSVSGQ